MNVLTCSSRRAEVIIIAQVSELIKLFSLAQSSRKETHLVLRNDILLPISQIYFDHFCLVFEPNKIVNLKKKYQKPESVKLKITALIKIIGLEDTIFRC